MRRSLKSLRSGLHWMACVAAVLGLAACVSGASTPNAPLPWSDQFGTSGRDRGTGVAVDADGSVLIGGHTDGALEGSNAGGADVFVRKVDGAGTQEWTRQFGTSDFDFGLAVAVDTDGHVLITGSTNGALGGTNAGSQDAFVRKLDRAGDEVWTRQFGTSNDEQGRAIAADADGNVLIAGHTGGALQGTPAGGRDAFLRKYDSAGNVVWTHQFGTSEVDQGLGVAVDTDGSILIVGVTEGALLGSSAGSADVFIRKYLAPGGLAWTRQFGTAGYDTALSVAVDGDGNVLVTGYVEGDLEGSSAGSGDAFVRKYDSAGNEVWTRQFGTAGFDSGVGVAVDANGNVVVTGYVEGELEGSYAGALDVFVRMYDSMGVEVWTDQSGTSGEEYGSGVAVDADGSVLIAGVTDGALAGSHAGDQDAFVRKYVP